MAAIGAIAGASVPLARAVREPWQLAVLAGALGWLLIARRSVPLGLVAARGVGVAAALLGRRRVRPPSPEAGVVEWTAAI